MTPDRLDIPILKDGLFFKKTHPKIELLAAFNTPVSQEPKWAITIM